MNRLALDLGTQCGWALNISGKILSGAWDLKDEHIPDNRFINFYINLRELLTQYKIDTIIYEDILGTRSLYAAQVAGGLKAILVLISDEFHLPLKKVASKTVKKFISGNGNSKKEVIRGLLLEKYKIESLINSISLDESDAVSILLWDIENNK